MSGLGFLKVYDMAPVMVVNIFLFIHRYNRYFPINIKRVDKCIL